jgi:AraC-like DNA-binding protein
MVLGLTDIINFISIFQLLIFILFLARKKTNRQSNKILAIFLIVQLFIISDYETFSLKNYLIKILPDLFFIGTSFIFLAAPTFYLYVKSLAFADFRLKKKHILHALPFAFAMMFFVFYFHIHSQEFKLTILLKDDHLPKDFWIVFDCIALTQILIYFVIDLNILKNYRDKIRQQYSSVKNINLSWLSFILYAFILSWITSVIVFLSRNYFWNVLDILILLNFFAFFIFFNYIFYKGLAQPEIFSGIEEKQKYVSSKLTSADADMHLTKLKSFMEHDKPYLNPDLTLKDLSTELSIPARHLSQIINEYMQSNFYDYISKYRIEEAKSILSDQSSNKTVLEILYEVGFNSKSSFNTAFKKFTGVTPSRFKKDRSAIT